MSASSPVSGRNFRLRVVSGLILFPLAVWLTWLGGFPFAVFAAFAAAVAAYELIAMVGGIGVPEAMGIAVAGAMPLAAAFAEGQQLWPAWGAPTLAAAVVLLLSVFLFRQEPLETIPKRMATVSMSWLYAGLLISTLVGLRRAGVGPTGGGPPPAGWHGAAWVLLAYVVTWANDTFAYFAGRAFGKHRMMERISPKKTWEGFAGGAVGSIVGALVTRALFEELAVLSALDAVLVGAGAAVLGPLGDFCESMVKRASGVKDSGKLIPGHGGILDRIDALLFVAPWVYVWAVYLR